MLSVQINADPLIIIPCNRAKIWGRHPHIGPVAARDAYVGTPFKVNRDYAERFTTRWRVLSAKYGFIDPSFVLDGPYEVTFKKQSTGPIPAAQLQIQARAKNLLAEHTVIGLGGKEYRAVLDQTFPTIMFPFAGLGLFEMVAEKNGAQ